MSGDTDRSRSATAPRAIPAVSIARIAPRDQSRRIVRSRVRCIKSFVFGSAKGS
jgi:hypothetical protein